MIRYEREHNRGTKYQVATFYLRVALFSCPSTLQFIVIQIVSNVSFLLNFVTVM